MKEQRGQQERVLERVYVEEKLSVNKLENIFSDLSSKYSLSYKEIIDMLKKREDYASIPASIFNNSLCPLENVVLYLHIKLGFTQTQIAGILSRDHTTIWTTISNALKKTTKSRYLASLQGKNEGIVVPVNIFSDDKLSILESVSIYMKDRFNMSYHEIALVLGKDDRTIWTVVNRARKKEK
jgi:predicted DNA-binding protein (UPF0251 family)